MSPVDADTASLPRVPPGFSPLPTHSPNTIVLYLKILLPLYVLIHPLNSESTTLATSSL